MATPPTLIAERPTAWNTLNSPKSAAAAAIQSGDVLVACGIREGWGTGMDTTPVVVTNDGAALTWTVQQAVEVDQYCEVRGVTAIGDSTRDLVATFTHASQIGWYGGDLVTFRGSDGVGATAKTNVASGAPSLDITTTQDNSAIVVIVADWNATDGTSRTWRTVNGTAPTAGNGYELEYQPLANYTLYIAYYPDAGTAGAKTVGLSAPTGQKYSIVAIEVKGAAGAGITTDQEGARFGNDDGSESAHTWAAAQDANLTAPLSQNLLLRLLLNATGDPATAAYTLRAQRNGAGGYVAVNVGATTTQEITPVGVGVQAVSTTSGGTVTAAWPAGYTAVADDVGVLIAVGKHNAGSSSAPGNPSGWGTGITRFHEIGTYDLQITVWVAKLTASQAAPGITVPAAYSTTAGGLSAQVAVFRGVDATTAQDATAVVSSAAAATTWAPTGITTATNGAMVVSVVGSADDNALALSAGSEQGFTISGIAGANYDTVTGGDHAVGMAYKLQATAGAVTCPTWNQTLVGADQWVGVTIALKPATITNPVYIAASANIAAGGEATTARLTAPGAKSTSSFTTGRRWDDENGSDSIDIAADFYTEVEWCLQAQSPAVNGDTFDFRVYAGATPLTTYGVTPRWTIGTPAGPVSRLMENNVPRASRLARLMGF